MLCRFVAVALCLTSVVLAHTIPSFADNEEYDLVMLAEQEALGAIPAAARLSPKVYESAEAARKAAEEELAKLGEEIDSIPAVEKKAETEALNYAVETASDPIHSDLEGIKVNLGHEGDYAAEERVLAPVPAPAEVNIETPKVFVDTQNAQIKKQSDESDVPMAKRGHANTRPSAPQFGNLPMPQFPGMPQMQFPGMPQQMQMPQMQMPQQMSQMQFPGFQFPGFPQQQQRPAVFSLVAPDVDEESKPSHNEQTAQPQPQNMFAGIPQYQSLFPPSVMQSPQMPMNFFQPQQLPPSLQSLPLMPNQMSEMMKQFPQLLQTMPAQTQNSAQFSMPTMPAMPAMPAMPDMGQVMQNMPQLLPQMMQQLPQMMQQMSQSMMHFAPQMMQQVPQVLQQFPSFGFPNLAQKKDEMSSTVNLGLEAVHHKSPKVRLAPLTHKHASVHKKH